jgi:3-hydroxyacyl-[acyl-carrier-protein] dehydratase
MDRAQIEALLPHRPPFLLVDEVTELEPGERCVAGRTLRADDFWFAGHFPGNPVMPGVLIVEALAQTATIAAASGGGAEGKIGLFAGIDKVRFKRVVKPGDTLRLEAEMLAVHGPVGKCKVLATVDGQLACRGELMFAVVDAAAVADGEARLGGGDP